MGAAHANSVSPPATHPSSHDHRLVVDDGNDLQQELHGDILPLSDSSSFHSHFSATTASVHHQLLKAQVQVLSPWAFLSYHFKLPTTLTEQRNFLVSVDRKDERELGERAHNKYQYLEYRET